MTTRVYCSVYGCLVSSIQNLGLAFFKLPADSKRRSEWLRLICRDDLINRPSNSYRVCENHFDTQHILPTSNRKILKKNSVPSLHLANLQNEYEEAEVVRIQVDNFTQTLKVTASASTQTTLALASTIPRNKKLKSDISGNIRKLTRSDILKNTKKYQRFIFHQLCDIFLTEELAKLVKAQTSLKCRHRGNRYHLDYKLFCLKLQKTSPQAYRLLQRALCLPCPNTLRSRHSVPTTNKINNGVMSALATKGENNESTTSK